MNVKQPIVLVSVSFVVVSLIVALIVFSEADNSKLKPLVIADAHQPVFALLYVAQAKGYFKEEGLTVNYRYFTSGRDALRDVVAGHSDLATVYETPVVLHSSQGDDVRVLSTLHKSTDNTGLLALSELDIQYPIDLIGKRIGVPYKTNAEFFLSLFLESHGIPLDEVELVDIAPQHLEEALVKREVDGIAVWNPHLFSIESRFKEGELVRFRSDVYTEMSVLAGSSVTLVEMKDEISALFRALVKAEKYIDANEEDSILLVMNQLDDLPEGNVRGVWNSFQPVLALDYVLLNVLKSEAEWLYEKGQVNNLKLDFEKIIDADFLKTVNPYAVTLVK